MLWVWVFSATIAKADPGSHETVTAENQPMPVNTPAQQPDASKVAIGMRRQPLEVWNSFYIKIIGDKVTVYLNGQLVVDNVTQENLWNRCAGAPATIIAL
jgi:hypothetical protein